MDDLISTIRMIIFLEHELRTLLMSHKDGHKVSIMVIIFFHATNIVPLIINCGVFDTRYNLNKILAVGYDV